jgi:hypothetical protein
MINWVEHKIMEWEPSQRRRASVHLLVWSMVLGLINVILYVVGVINVDHLILVTLVLSWLAITITAMDLVATTDVREEST